MKPPFKIGDPVMLKAGYNGNQTRHTITSIEQSRCQGGWLVRVDPKVKGASDYGFSCDWFERIES